MDQPNYVIGYPPPPQSTTNNPSTYNGNSHPPTQAIQNNQNPNQGQCNPTICMTFITAFSTLFIILFLYTLQPFLPKIRVAPTTSNISIINVSNNRIIIADLDVGFSIFNRDNKGFVYDNINASIYYGTERLSNTTIEQRIDQHGRDYNTIAWARFAAVPVHFDEWLMVNDTVMDEPRVTHLTFVLQARAWYKGFTWPTKRDTIKFVCENKKVVFPSNTTKTMEFLPRECNVYGRWSNISFLLLAFAFGSFFLVIILGLAIHTAINRITLNSH